MADISFVKLVCDRRKSGNKAALEIFRNLGRHFDSFCIYTVNCTSSASQFQIIIMIALAQMSESCPFHDERTISIWNNCIIRTEYRGKICIAKAGTLHVVHKICIEMRRPIERFLSFKPSSCNHTALSKGMRYILVHIRVLPSPQLEKRAAGRALPLLHVAPD